MLEKDGPRVLSIFAAVARLAAHFVRKTRALWSTGGSNPPRGIQPVAQRNQECLTTNQEVAGSNPARLAYFECQVRNAECGMRSPERCLPHFMRVRSSTEQERQFPKLEVAGSNPAGLMGLRNAERGVGSNASGGS